MTLEMDLTHALAKLGTTTEEIAESLKVKSCKGYRRQAESCPIAVYLKAEFPQYNVFVDGVWIDMLILGGLNSTNLDAPEVIHDFVQSFDAGQFPDLEA